MKTFIRSTSNTLGMILLSISCISTSTTANAQVETSPLFIANRVEPNVFFMVDDSGSMGGSMLIRGIDDTHPTSSGGTMTLCNGPACDSSTNDRREYDDITWPNNNYGRILPTQAAINIEYAGSLASEPTLRGVWRGRSHDYNPIYYNPTRTYEPWDGYVVVGDFPTQYPNSVPTAARYNPYTTGTIDLTVDHTVNTAKIGNDGSDNPSGTRPGPNWMQFTYYYPTYNVWKDTANPTLNGRVDPDEPYVKIEIRPLTPVCASGVNASKTEQMATGCMLRPYAQEIQNFANFYTYHRARHLTAKYALARVIRDATNIRMGMATINENRRNAQRELKSMGGLGVNSTEKKALFDGLFQVNPSGLTPLRQALARVGRYYGGQNNGPNFPDGSGGFINNAVGIDLGSSPATAPGRCSQNFTILMSDGVRNGGGGGTNLTASAGVGNADNSTTTFSADYYDGQALQTGANLSFAGIDPYRDGDSDTLADVAMYYYNIDLFSSTNGSVNLDNYVPISCGSDENPAQHMVTYTVGFGVTGAIPLSSVQDKPHPKLGYPANCTASTEPSFNWAPGGTTNQIRIDDLIHAAYNGRGEYLSAESPETLSSSISQALRDITGRTASAAAVALTSTSLSTNTDAFFARFNSSNWQGQLFAFGIDSNATINQFPKWDNAGYPSSVIEVYPAAPDPVDRLGGAHTLLAKRDAADRAIVTYNPSTTNGIAFRSFASLTPAQQSDLSLNSSDTPDSYGQQRLDFLRGDHTCEVSAAEDISPVLASCSGVRIFRNRLFTGSDVNTQFRRFKLGDIVHSAPVFVGAPQASIPGTDPFGASGQRFRDFKNGVVGAGAFTSGKNATNRTPMVYVGANDGMLHAFNANTGDELWAYIPNALFDDTGSLPGLHYLTQENYEHQYYVDLSPTVADAFINTGTGDKWHTVLVGGLRAGGRGYFAIDVTDPDAISGSPAARESSAAAKIMWEFTNADDVDLGYAYSEPAVVPFKTGSGTIDYYVVIGNGYSNTNSNTATRNSSKLFILKLEGPGADNVWDLNTDYWKIDTEFQATDATALSLRNGLATPVVADSDSDNIGDFVYAGDLQGHLWAFDFTSDTPSNWDVYRVNNSPSAATLPLFRASDGNGGAGNAQPITVKPTLIFNDSIATVKVGAGKNTPNLLIQFGTGNYLNLAALSDTTVQSFYGVWDNGETDLRTTSVRTVDRSFPASSDLVQQTISTDTAPDSSTVRVNTSPQPVSYNNTSGKFGWFMDLPTSGERVIVNPVAVSSLVFFKTLIPSPDACGFGGTSWSMAVDALTGAPPQQPLQDFNNDSAIDTSDQTSGGHVAVGTSESKLIFDNAFASIPKGGGIGGVNCPDGYEKKVEIVTLSDGSTKSQFYCVPQGAKVGRYSWRELKF